MTTIPFQISTLSQAFQQRVATSPHKTAYRYFDKTQKQWHDHTWLTMATAVKHWQSALRSEALQTHDRIAIMLRNSPSWVIADQATLGLGLINVPLFVDDRPDNVAYILAETQAQILLIDGALQWKRLYPQRAEFKSLKRIISLTPIDDAALSDERLVSLSQWLADSTPMTELENQAQPANLASIIYTSGTTGKPKGVMLSHANLVKNAQAAQRWLEHEGMKNEVFLSFLPLSHTLERTAGYYLPMLLNSCVVYTRSIQQLASDIQNQKPSVIISVPRIYEQIYIKIQHQIHHKSRLIQWLFKLAVQTGEKRFEYQQGRAAWTPSLLLAPLLDQFFAKPLQKKLGGQLKVAICGGAALPPQVGRFFLGMGITIVQGYGLTETSPILSVNRPDNNIPESIGLALEGVEVKLGQDNELLTRSPYVMQGYWNNPEVTQAVIDADGWFHTGDIAQIDAQKHLYIVGRLKDVIVMGNGEKVPPVDMEVCIVGLPLVEQVMVIGEGKAYLAALLVLHREQWVIFAETLQLDPNDEASLHSKIAHRAILKQIAQQTKSFPGYAQVRRLHLSLEPWSIDNGLLTPTMKVRRLRVLAHYASAIDKLYAGFELE